MSSELTVINRNENNSNNEKSNDNTRRDATPEQIVQEQKIKTSPVAHADIQAKAESKKWFYTETVKDHFFNPRNILIRDEEIDSHSFDGVGMVGSPACGDGMKMWITVDKNQDK